MLDGDAQQPCYHETLPTTCSTLLPTMLWSAGSPALTLSSRRRRLVRRSARSGPRRCARRSARSGPRRCALSLRPPLRHRLQFYSRVLRGSRMLFNGHVAPIMFCSELLLLFLLQYFPQLRFKDCELRPERSDLLLFFLLLYFPQLRFKDCELRPDLADPFRSGLHSRFMIWGDFRHRFPSSGGIRRGRRAGFRPSSFLKALFLRIAPVRRVLHDTCARRVHWTSPNSAPVPAWAPTLHPWLGCARTDVSRLRIAQASVNDRQEPHGKHCVPPPLTIPRLSKQQRSENLTRYGW